MPRKRMPRVSMLKIDKDVIVDSDWIHEYLKLILTVCSWRKIKVQSVKMCRSMHKGLHFYVNIAPAIEATLANRLHWLLGDDCLRVDFNRARIESGLKDWSKLFERANVRLETIYPSSRLRSQHQSTIRR